MWRIIGYGDNIGSGFQKILCAWETLGYPRPDLKELSDVHEVWLKLPLSNISEIDSAGDTEKPVCDTDDDIERPLCYTDSDTDNVAKDVSDVDARRNKVLYLMKSSPCITTNQLAKELKVSRPTISRDINYLTSKGLLRREGGDFGGRWVIIERRR